MQLDFFHNSITVLPEPPKPRKGEGWYEIGVRVCPDLQTGKMELIERETPIYAKTLMAAKQAASKWAKPFLLHRMPVDGKWEETRSSTNRYGKYWKKKGKYFSCNPEIYLIPNSVTF